MSDLLKEAIADAKAVRETALQNAKMALEEAFTPQLKSMLSAKLKEEEGVPYEEDEAGDGLSDDEVDTDIVDAEGGSDGEADDSAEEQAPDEPSATAGEGEESGVPGSQPDTEYEEDNVGDGESEDEVPNDGEELNQEGMYSEEDDVDEVPAEDAEVEESDNLDLETIVKELEDELGAEEEFEEGERVRVPAEEDEEEVEETIQLNGQTYSLVKEEEGEDEEEIEVDESIFNEEEGDEEEVEESNDSDTAEISAELKEYKDAVRFLKNKLHEVNILNAKLLFTNKLFKEFVLNNNQKLKVVETFDRAQSTREIKLVYSTLAEQFGDNGSITKKHSISESASSKSGSTKPSQESKKVITEESQVAERFKKLAGLIK